MMKTPVRYQRFNQPDTLLVVSSFPLRGEEIAKRNAVSRYSDLLLSHFPEAQKVVVLCERVEGQDNRAYLFRKNVLILPSFVPNTLSLFRDLTMRFQQFSAAKNILLQFEFSLFGKEVITFLLPFFFLWQRFSGKQIAVMLHQVVLDLSTLSGQVLLPAHALKTQLFNLAMKLFYATFGLASQQVLVHDQLLASKLQGLVTQQKIQIIPHGINGNQNYSSEQRLRIKERLGLKKTDRVLLAYGYHSWYKGTDWLVKNFLRLKATQQLPAEVKLVLAGDVAPTQKNQAHLRRYYQKLTKQIQQHSAEVIHTGFVPEKEVAQIFAIADLCVFPYRSRMSSSGALALAFQYHKPFIVSQAFAENLTLPHIQKEAQRLSVEIQELVFSLHALSFAGVLRKVWGNQDFQKKISLLGAAVARQQSWQKAATQYLQVFQSQKNSFRQSVSRLRFNFSRKVPYIPVGV